MRYVFYISDHGLTAYSYKDAENNKSESFEWKDVALIDSLLATLEDDAEADVILDLIDEEIHFEWAPKVQPWEKQSIAKRRKNRLQNDSTILSKVSWTNVQRVSDEGRKEELMLAATISDSYNVSTFLQNLEDAQVILRSIYSKPFLLRDFFKDKVRPYLKLNRNDLKKPFLLISRQSENVFRQTFFNEGELRLSRLVEIDEQNKTVTDIRKALLAESKLAVAYVYNQKIVPFNSAIGFVFMDGEEEMLDGVLAECQEEGLIRSSWEESDYFAGVVNFRELAEGGAFCGNYNKPCYSMQAVVDFIINKRTKSFYSNSYVNKINALLHGRSALIGINGLLFIFGLYYILITGIDSWLSFEKQKMLDEKIVQHQNEKSRLEKMVQLQDDAQKIKASVEFSESILSLKMNRLISFDVNALSRVFLNNENIQLSKISWQTLDRFDSKSNQIDINAWVFPFYETYHDPVMWVDKFVNELREIDGMQSVTLEKEPLNRKVSQALTINTNKGSVQALPFTVTLRIKDVETK